MPETAKAAECDSGFPACVQITFSSLSASAQSYSAFRISPDDTIHFAQWSGQKRLLAVGAPTRRADVTYKSALKTVSGAFGWFQGGGSGGGSQFSNWVEVAHFGARKTRSRVLSEPSDDIEALVARLGEGAIRHAPEPGVEYVWTTPVQSAGLVDLKINAPQCAGPVQEAISASLTTGAIAVPVGGGTDPYLTGENKNRIVFVADIAGRLTQFGILRA